MQARFLKKVVDNYETMKAQSSISPSHRNKPTQQDPADNSNSNSDAIYRSSNLTSRTTSRNDYAEAMVMEREAQEEEPTGVQSQVTMGNYAFSDNEMWEKMFAEAGFRLNDGVFMPEAMGP